MFKGFGFEDPFKNDPFFNRGSGKMFGGIENMMQEMRSNMMDMGSVGGSGAQSRFFAQTESKSTKIGPNGQPVTETYSHKTKGAIGPDGKRITERH